MKWDSDTTRRYEKTVHPGRGGCYSDDRFPSTVKSWRRGRHLVMTAEECAEYLEAMRFELKSVLSRADGSFEGRGQARLIASEMEQVRAVCVDLMKSQAVAA